MTSRRPKAERVSAREAAKRLGMTEQSLGAWASKPGAPTEMDGTRRWILWPDFPVFYRQQLIASREKPSNLTESEQRIAAADAETKEFKLQIMRGEWVRRDESREIMRKLANVIRSQLLAVPGRYAARTAGKATLIESQAAWDAAVRDILNDLRNGDSAS